MRRSPARPPRPVRPRTKRMGRLVAPGRAAILLPLVALLVLAWVDLEPRAGWNEIKREHRKYETQARQIETLLASDARIAATQGPHYEVYLDRPVYSLEFAVKRAGLRIDGDGVDTDREKEMSPGNRNKILTQQEIFEALLLNDYRPDAAARWLASVAHVTVRTIVCSFLPVLLIVVTI